MIALNLREDDELINVSQSNGQNYIFLASNIGNGLLIHEKEVSPVGQRTLGVIGLQLKDDEKMVSGSVFDPNVTKEIALITQDRKSTRLNSSHVAISYAVFCLKK